MSLSLQRIHLFNLGPRQRKKALRARETPFREEGEGEEEGEVCVGELNVI